MDVRRHLYHARINRRLSLQQVGTRTALSPSILKNLDEGRFELLPSGLYARSYVRTFAAEVGLDPERTLAEVEHLLPGAPDPLPVLNEMKSGRFDGFDFGASKALLQLVARLKTTTIARLGQMRTAVPEGLGTRARALQDNVGGWSDAWNPMAFWRPATSNGVEPFSHPVLGSPGRVSTAEAVDLEPVLNRVEPRQELELSRADPRPDPVLIRVDPRPDPELIRADPRKNAVATRAQPWLSSCTAAAIDALVLLAVDALLILLISLSSGLGIDVLLRSSALALGGFCAIPVALYFVIFEGIAGTTLGRWIFRLIDPSPQHPLRLPDILRRSVFR